jgi:hypothetical protein
MTWRATSGTCRPYAEDCPAQWPNASYVSDWCCDAWCYVDSTCASAEQSQIVTGLYYSMDATDSSGTLLSIATPSDSGATCPYSCPCTNNSGQGSAS